MQRLAEICIRRPVFASMLVLALCVVGGVSWFKLAVDRYPSVDVPSVRVQTRLPGAAPEEVETEVSERIEEAVNTVAGVEQLRSISGSGNGIILATFELERDIDVAAQDVRDRVSSVVRDLPDETDPPLVAKVDNDSEPVLQGALIGERSVRDLEGTLGLRQPGLSQQLAELREAGLIVGRKDGKAMHYRLADDRVAAFISVMYRLFCDPRGAPLKDPG